MIRTLYLMRHGQTIFNEIDKAQGWCDSPLTEEGIRQTIAAARHLKEKNIPFDYFCCSTAERGTDTLELMMQEMYGEPRPYDRMKELRERFYGLYEAATTAIMSIMLQRDPDSCVPFGGEPLAECKKRMHEGLERVMMADGHDCVLAISSMLSSLAFAETVGADDPAICWDNFNNCAYFVFDFDTETKKFTFRDLVRTNDGRAF